MKLKMYQKNFQGPKMWIKPTAAYLSLISKHYKSYVKDIKNNYLKTLKSTQKQREKGSENTGQQAVQG